jgi:hypothetical protein
VRRREATVASGLLSRVAMAGWIDFSGWLVAVASLVEVEFRETSPRSF